jgi:hypothetical protein
MAARPSPVWQWIRSPVWPWQMTAASMSLRSIGERGPGSTPVLMNPGRTPVPSIPSRHSDVQRSASLSALSSNACAGRYLSWAAP